MKCAPFKPAKGLASAHLQTCWAPFFRRLPAIERREEKLQLPDGDHVWLYSAGPELHDGAPCVLLFHGLGGSRCSHYVQGMQATLTAAGISSIAMDARGAGERPNDKAYCYHAGSTETIDALVAATGSRFPASPLFAVGYSLGATQLLNWLIRSQSTRLSGAVGVSAALWLKACATKLDGNALFSHRYRRYLLKGLLDDLERKRAYLLATNPVESEPLVMLEPFENVDSFFEFDERINAPLHHFAGADDYYEKCSPGGRLQQIRTPTLLLQAKDDPFMQTDRQPPSGQIGNVYLETSDHGGHVGFVAGSITRPTYWAEDRVMAWLETCGVGASPVVETAGVGGGQV